MKFNIQSGLFAILAISSFFLSCSKTGLSEAGSSKNMSASAHPMGGNIPFPNDSSQFGASLFIDDGAGGQFHKQWVNLYTKPGVHAWNFGLLRTSDQVVVCSAGDNPDDNSDPKNLFQFFSNTAVNTTQYCGTPTRSFVYPSVTFSVHITGQDGIRRRYNYSEDPFIGQAILTITHFGPVGDYISGTFNGTLVELFNPSHILNVSSGFFKLPRAADYTNTY